MAKLLVSERLLILLCARWSRRYHFLCILEWRALVVLRQAVSRARRVLLVAHRVQALVRHILEQVGTLSHKPLPRASSRGSTVALAAVIPLTLAVRDLLAHIVIHGVRVKRYRLVLVLAG